MDGRLAYLSRLLWGVVVTAALLGLVAFRVTSCAPTPRPPPHPGQAAAPPSAEAAGGVNCNAPGWEHAAELNAGSLRALAWTPFGRDETGWRIYAPLIAHEIGADCPPQSQAFARALADWQKRQGVPPDGVLSQLTFIRLKGLVQERRPFVLLAHDGFCAMPADEQRLAAAGAEEAMGDKPVQLRPGALRAYRRMVAAARADDPAIAADPDLLKIFSGYRSPTYDAARCLTENNCNGRERATCSPHRTGLAMDLYLGHAPGFTADSSADDNRLYLTEGAAYRWLLANAGRYGFVNYPFEPWHWEWTGEKPRPGPPPAPLPAAPADLNVAGIPGRSGRSAGP